METKVIKIDPANPDMVRVAEAASMIDAGALVAFPTETVYGIGCRVGAELLKRLSRVKGRDPQKHYTLHIGDGSDVRRYVPTLGMRAQKLIDRAWPGPLTIVFELNAADAAKQRMWLEKEVFEGLYADNSIGIRCPDHVVASVLLSKTRGPVVAPSANVTSQRPAVDAGEVLAQFGGQIDLVLDSGPCKYKKSSTVVKVSGAELKVLRAGVYSQADLAGMSEIKFLFVCTGNSCRSPMAEGMFRKYFAEKLGCDIDALERMGYKVISAGTMGMAGGPASPQAVAACLGRGVDITGHKSRALCEELISESDFIFAMSRVHRERVSVLCRDAAKKCLLLVDNEDVSDPIGQPQQAYERCAEIIEKGVRKRIGELVV